MRICLTATLIGLSLGCATKDPGLVKTRIISFPDGALVEYNGQNFGRTPAEIALPQNEHGRLTERAEILVLPNSNQPDLYPQRRVFDPATRKDRVPDRVMVDMTRGGTNEVQIAGGLAPHVETNTRQSIRPPVPYVDRGKPTQAVGLERWKPGIY